MLQCCEDHRVFQSTSSQELTAIRPDLREPLPLMTLIGQLPGLPESPGLMTGGRGWVLLAKC
jgi:hypothetical protein